MKTAFVFAGQGSQYVSMGKDFYENYDIAKEVYDTPLDFDVKQTCFEDKDKNLNQTEYTQSCVFLTSMAIANALKKENITPDCVCGLSLGEYSALCFAGAFSIKDGAQIVRKRGQLMANALPLGTTKMAAVLNCDADTIEKVCSEVEGVCQVANYNCPTQIVITGENDAVDKAAEKLSQINRVRVMSLNVSGAFHSSLLKDAANQLGEVLENYDINIPTMDIYYNISGNKEKLSSKSELIDVLKKQIQSSVYFYQSIENMIKDGVELFVEIGPGSTLSKFINKTDRNAKVVCVDKIGDIEKLKEIINGK